MVELPAWRMGEFLRIVLLFLWNKPEGASTREILTHISHSTSLTGQETAPFPSAPDFPVYEILVRAAMTAVAKAGWLARTNFKWTITGEGRLVCRDFGNAQEFYTESQKIIEVWRQNRPAAMLAIEDAEEKAWTEVRQYLLGLGQAEFKSLVTDLLESMDYHILWTAPPEKERGSIDLLASQDPLGVGQPRMVVHVKHQGQAVTAEGMKATLSSLGRNDVGLVISSGGFTRDARDLIRTQPIHEIALIDLERFFTLWLEYYGKLSQPARQRLPVRAVHFLALEEM
jgi:restriction system protein